MCNNAELIRLKEEARYLVSRLEEVKKSIRSLQSGLYKEVNGFSINDVVEFERHGKMYRGKIIEVNAFGVLGTLRVSIYGSSGKLSKKKTYSLYYNTDKKYKVYKLKKINKD